MIIQKLIQFIQEYPQEYLVPQQPSNSAQQSSQKEMLKQDHPNGKIIFHCSAGIGRTGTIIAIYNIIESLRILTDNQEVIKTSGDQTASQEVNGMTPRISIFSVVRRLREQRYCMVQSVSQYEFIYEYILDYLSSQGMITCKFPRNTFGLEQDEDRTDEDESEGQIQEDS